MRAPPHPANEAQRLGHMKILNTLPEEHFDRLTRPACCLFNT